VYFEIKLHIKMLSSAVSLKHYVTF